MQRNLEIIERTTEIVASYVGNNSIGAGQVPDLISSVHSALASQMAEPVQQEPQKPAVPIKRSVTPDYVICLEDGAKLKMLKRYLRTHFNMTPEEYRRKWNLPADYPMVAPNYAEARSKLAKKIGLGRKPAEAAKPARAAAKSSSKAKTTRAKSTAKRRTTAKSSGRR